MSTDPPATNSTTAATSPSLPAAPGPTSSTKGTKIKRALISAARLPTRVPYLTGRPGKATRNASTADMFSPKSGEQPVVVLRVQVLGCMSLAVKDRNGSSDPFVTVAVLKSRHQTPVVKKNLNPVFAAKDATFDFPLYASLADKLGAIELVVWDKDRFTKADYLGEVALALDDWFVDRNSPDGEVRAYGFDEDGNSSFSLNLTSTRADTPPTGSVQLKLGFVRSPDSQKPNVDFKDIYADFVKRATSRPSLVSAPPTEGVGTVRRSEQGQGPPYEYDLQDDGGISSDPDGDDTDDEGDAFNDAHLPHKANEPAAVPQISVHPGDTITPTTQHAPGGASAAGGDGFDLRAVSPSTPTPGDHASTPKPIPDAIVSGITTAALTGSPPSSGGLVTAPTTAAPSAPPPAPSSKGFNAKNFVRKLSGFSTTSSNPPSEPTSPYVSDREGVDGPESFVQKKRIPFVPRKKWTGSSTTSTSTTSGSSPATPGVRSVTESGLITPASEVPSAGAAPAVKEKKNRRKKDGYSFGGENDIVGIVMLEIKSAEDLPRLKNMTRTGWDMDPFVVISFGKKVFRTRVIRHSRDPVWEEKLLFHVRRYETAFKVQLTVLDWDKLSANDLICETSFDLKDLIDDAPQADPKTGLYDGKNDGGDHPMKDFRLDCAAAVDGGVAVVWEGKHKPVLNVRAKYQPYSALRQHFWRTYLQQYDTDDTKTTSQLELQSMLDSLGSTLSPTTINSFFTRFGKNPNTDELTFDEAILCLENELNRPESERRVLDVGDDPDSSVSATPVLGVLGSRGEEVQVQSLDFSGQPVVDSTRPASGSPVIPANSPYPTSGVQAPLDDVAAESEDEEEDSSTSPGTPPQPGLQPAAAPHVPLSPTTAAFEQQKKNNKIRFKVRRKGGKKAKNAQTTSQSGGSDDALADGTRTQTATVAHERLINVKNCPLCHRPRMNDKAEKDIITHLAVCASQDWNKVDRIVVGNFVTASQAQRKWYTKVIGKLSSGDYKLGANSANIIVQNRVTGQLEEEKMAVYVRLGIRLLYKGAGGRMEGGRARNLLKSLSVKQGIKFDDPKSAADIPGFIAFHNLPVSEIQDPLDSFKTFNEFFYRKLKASARPIAAPEDPLRVVSAADCRFMAFETVSEATRLWIKGREFTVKRLLGEKYANEAAKYENGALAIFRLAPQDYHRFHVPVAGRIGEIAEIKGEYYTVNPQAIRTALDVYGENARKIVPIDSPEFGRVMAVCVGAMMVGTIKTTVKEGDLVAKGQEFGYFAFGGSTIVMLFEPGRVTWDEDLLDNGKAALETLIKVGSGIGRGTPASS